MIKGILQSYTNWIVGGFIAIFIGWIVWLNYANASMRKEITELTSTVERQSATIDRKNKEAELLREDLDQQIETLMALNRKRDSLELAFKLYRGRVQDQIAALEDQFFTESTVDRKTAITKAIKENDAAYTELRLKASEIIRKETLDEYCVMFPTQPTCLIEEDTRDD